MWSDYPHSSTLDYVIRHETLNPSCITWLPSNAKLCFRALIMLPLWLSHLSSSLFVFDSVLSWSTLITDLITLKIDFHFENSNRGKRQLRLLALFLLSRGFYMFREIQKKYMENNKPSHKSINTTIVLVVIGNPVREPLSGNHPSS